MKFQSPPQTSDPRAILTWVHLSDAHREIVTAAQHSADPLSQELLQIAERIVHCASRLCSEESDPHDAPRRQAWDISAKRARRAGNENVLRFDGHE